MAPTRSWTATVGTVPPQYAGGITDAGVRNIKAFVEGGGTLVTLNNACLFAIERLGLAGDRRAEGAQADGARRPGGPGEGGEVRVPGLRAEMQFDPKHPVAYGMPEEAPGHVHPEPGVPVRTRVGGKGAGAIAKYPRKNLLMSGFLKGEQYLQNTVAAVDVPLGKGRVILLGFGVEQRGQPHGTFKLLFNALLYSVAR